MLKSFMKCMQMREVEPSSISSEKDILSDEHEVFFIPNLFLKCSNDEFRCGVVDEDDHVVEVDINAFTSNSNSKKEGTDVPLSNSLDEKLEDKKLLEEKTLACKSSLVELVKGMDNLYSQPTSILDEEFVFAKDENVVYAKVDPMLIEKDVQILQAPVVHS